MLFSCCLKKKTNTDQNQHKQNLKETLINKENDRQTQITKVQATQQIENTKKNQPSNLEEKTPVIINQKLEQMKLIQSYSTLNRFQEDAEIQSQIERSNAAKTLMRMPSQEESTKTRKKSDLWSQAGNKILYFISQKDEEMVMTYKVSQRKVQTQLLDYVLQPHRFSSKFKNKPTDFSLSLVLSSQSLSKLKGIITNLIPDPHVRPIFGVFKKQNQQKLAKSHYQTDCYIHDIITVGNNCLRLQAFERIIIMLNSQKDFSSIMSECQKITQHFQLQEIAKISFVFPAYLTLSQINAILSKINRKFLISEKLQKTINHLGFYVELFQHTNFEQAIIVSSIENIYKQDDKINKDFQIKLELAIGLLMIEIDYNNAKLFSAVITNFLMDKTVSEYLKFIEFLHKDKKEFISKIQAMKIFDPEQLQEIQKSRKMQEKILNPHEKTITIKYRHKRKLGQLFQEYHTTKTPVEQYQRKKEWDDDLRQNDISATIIQKPESKIESDCNIFEVIEDSYVEKADLDILPDDDQMQFQQDD